MENLNSSKGYSLKYIMRRLYIFLIGINIDKENIKKKITRCVQKQDIGKMFVCIFDK